MANHADERAICSIINTKQYASINRETFMILRSGTNTNHADYPDVFSTQVKKTNSRKFTLMVGKWLTGEQPTQGEA